MKKHRQLYSAMTAFVFLLVGVVGLRTTAHPAAATATPASALAANPTAAPEDVGLSSERLERIASVIQKSVADGRIAGGVTLVARHGKVAYLKAVGMADREAKKPMRTDSIFRICSMTKPLTSVAVMMLYEEGHFTLDEPVSHFIPEFKNMKVLDPPYPQDKTSPPGALVDAKRPITIRHLLTHTSGLTYHWNARLGKLYREAGFSHGLLQQEGTIGDGIKKLASLPLLFQPRVVTHFDFLGT
jgi:CubicO group peptidase (beta-lactamase class C family)